MVKVSFSQKNSEYHIEINSRSPFKEDNVIYESEKYRIQGVGCILNKEDCIKEWGGESFCDLLVKLASLQKPICQILNGVYFISIFDKETKKLKIYNDLLSKQSIFYSYHQTTGQLVLSDKFFDVIGLLRERGLPYSIDSLGVKMMLKHRMFYHDLTYINEIKFLRPFEYIEIDSNSFSVKEIEREGHMNTTISDAVESINQIFSKAVGYQYLKNEKNGYPQIITLSGGMDSRSTFLFSLSQGYTNQKCFCYAESTSVDYEYARQLAIKYHCDFYFHPIDNGDFLLKRNELCRMNEGQMVYSGPTGAYDSLSFYSTPKMGIVHTGLGGGEIMGDMRIIQPTDIIDRFITLLKYRFGKGKKDNTWASFLNSLDCNNEERERLVRVFDKYRDFDEFQSINDIRRCLNSQKVAMAFGVYYISPFLYEDFFCYMLRVPTLLTKDRKLYLAWQKKYNPAQFEIPSTFQMGCKPYNKWGYYAKRFAIYIANKMGRKTKYDMTPNEYWLANNPEMSKQLEMMYFQDIDILKDKIDRELYHYMVSLWNNYSGAHPNLLTATWALRNICYNSKNKKDAQ